MFLGLRTAIYPTSDLAVARAFATKMLGVEPYFDEPFYVGYDVAGFEFALHPGADPAVGVMAYWGVANIDDAAAALIGCGAALHSGIDDVGDRIRVATFTMPGSGVLGVIENPHYVARHVPSGGPGQ